MAILSAPTLGTTSVNTMTGEVSYTPNANLFGNDSFEYQICDTGSGCDEATVTITITAVNDAPVAVADSGSTDENMAVTVGVLLNDSDVDGDALTVASLLQPTNGVALINIDKTVSPTRRPSTSAGTIFSLIQWRMEMVDWQQAW